MHALGQIATSIGDLLHALEQHRAVRRRGLPIEPSTLPLSRSLRVLVERALDAADASLCEPHEPKSS